MWNEYFTAACLLIAVGALVLQNIWLNRAIADAQASQEEVSGYQNILVHVAKGVLKLEHDDERVKVLDDDGNVVMSLGYSALT